MKMVSPFI